LFAGLVIIDQTVKYAAVTYGRIFRNYLFAFSVPLPAPVMYLVYAVILAVITWHVMTKHQTFTDMEKVGWTLVIAGSVSNIGERLINGYVKDFIYLLNGVFNVADFYILLGIILLFVTRRRPKQENILGKV